MPDTGITNIGKYSILDLVGEGAMGVVYRARDTVLNRPVAVKVMSDAVARQVDLRERFLREAQAAGSLQHPNVITIYDFGEVDGHLYIAMEFVEGIDLERVLSSREPISLQSKLDLAIEVLNGLAYAHKRGIIHRDIKPANIRIDEEGRAKIMDFGVARLESSSMTVTGMMVGTPSYMSPEQVTGGRVTPASDLFAFGAVLYELLTNTKPFEGPTLHGILYKIVSEDPPPPSRLLPGLPPALDQIVAKALAKDPAARYASAVDMASDLSAVRASLSGAPAAAGTVSLRVSVANAKALRETGEMRAARARRAKTIFLGLAAGAASAAILTLVLRAPAGEPARPAPTAAPVVSAVTGTLDSTRTPAPAAAAPAAAAPAFAAATPSATLPPATTPAPSRRPAASSSAAERAASGRSPRGTDARPPAPRASRSEPAAVATAPVSPPATLPAPIASTAPPPPPAVVSAPVPTPAPSAANATAEVTSVVARYARAIESHDLAEVRRAYPGISPAQLRGFEQFFEAARSIRATFSVSRVEVADRLAEAQVTGAYDYEANGKRQHQPVSFRATLRREAGGWQLVSVQ